MTTAKAEPKTFHVTVGRQRRHVVLTKPTHWLEQLENGHLRAHVGKLLDKPSVVKVADKPGKCGRCKAPSWATTPLGRVVHHGCDGWLHTLPDQQFGQLVFDVAAAIGDPDPNDPLVQAQQLLQAELGARPARRVAVVLPAHKVSARVVAGLARAARNHPGPLPLYLRLFNGGGQTVELPTHHLVSPHIADYLAGVFGPLTTTVKDAR